MEEVKFKVTLADGTEIDNLTLNGNNFISSKKITEDAFEGNLDTVEIYDYSTEETQVLHNAVLIQLEKYGKEYWFILAEKSEAEIERENMLADIEVQAQAIEELASIIAEMEG